ESTSQVEDLARQVEELARRQQAFEGQMRKAFGPQSQGLTREQAGQLAGEKDSEIQDLKRLQQGMQSAVRDLQNTQRKAATKMRDALGGLQQAEIERDMQRNADWIRRGMGGYAVMSEATITQGVNELKEQLKEVQQALGQGTKDGKGGQDDKLTESALGQVERLRQQLEQMSAQRAQQGQNGQNGQRGQQSLQRGQQGQQGQQGGQQGQQGQQGQRGQGQQGQQGGQQGGGQQGGQQGGGQQGGQMQQGGGPTNGGGGSYGGAHNGNPNGGPWYGYGDPRNALQPVNPQDFQNNYTQTLQTLRQLEQQAQ